MISFPSFWFAPASGGMFQSQAGSGAAPAVNGDPVGYLPDLGGAGLHLQSTADDTTRPTLQGVGVTPYLNFDGANDGLRHVGGTSGAYAAGVSSWFVAMRSNGNIANSCLLAEESSSSTTPLYSILSYSTPSTATVLIRNDANTTLFNSNTSFKAGVFNGADHVFGVVDDGSGLTPYLDGVAGSRIAYTRSGTLTLNELSLGALFRTTIGNWWAGRVYGVVGANRVLTSTEIADLTAYLTGLYTAPAVSALNIVSGDQLGCTVSQSMVAPLVIQAVDASSNPVSGITVNWSASAGSLSASTSVTGSDGKAQVNWTAPSTPQTNTITASFGSISAQFTEQSHMVLYGAHSAFPALLKAVDSSKDPLVNGFIPDTGYTWTIVSALSDEFTGSAIDTTKWYLRLPGGYDHYNDELQRYVDSAVTVSGGTCKITAVSRTGTIGHAASPSGFQYTLYDSGVITTKSTITGDYYAECRLKLPSGQGVWPAYWGLPTTDYHGEADFMEYVYNNGTERQNMIHNNNLCDGGGNQVYWSDSRYNTQYGFWSAPSTMSPTYMVDDWRVLACLKRGSTTTIYLDGQPLSQRKLSPSNLPMQIIHNLAMGGGWPTTNSSGTAWTQPVSLGPEVFEIDYTRVYTPS